MRRVLALLFLALCLVGTRALPDLTIDVAAIEDSLEVVTRYFTADSCEWNERCIEGLGTRTLATFDLTTPNIGTTDLNLGDPNINTAIFRYDNCHNHFHFETYANYRLEKADETVVARGRKAAFCLGDWGGMTAMYNNSLPYYNEEAVPNDMYYDDCNANQGISVGYQDTYSKNLDCQWIDVTDVLAGDYLLRVALNENRTIAEMNYNNNLYYVPMSIRCAEYDYATVPYGWTDTTGATALGPLGPNQSAQVNLTPPLRFACQDHSALYIHANGFLAWTPTDTTGITERGSDYLTNTIMAYYSKWSSNPAEGGAGTIKYKITGDAPARTITVSWEGVRHADFGEGNEVSFQLRLIENSQNWQVNVRDGTTDDVIPVKTGVCSTYDLVDCTEYFPVGGERLGDGASLGAEKKLQQVGSANRPTASPNGPYHGVVQEPVQFFGSGYDADSGTTLSYVWTFGDGSVPVVGQNPEHTFEKTGVFNVSIKSFDGFQQSQPSWTKATILLPGQTYVSSSETDETSASDSTDGDTATSSGDGDGDGDGGSSTDDDVADTGNVRSSAYRVQSLLRDLFLF